MNRTSIINALLAKCGGTSYLEIGVYDGVNFDNILAARRVGVDPVVDARWKNPEMIRVQTSDDFFASNTEKFDVIFVDGLHLRDQVKRDVENGLTVLKPGGYIVCHDMNPQTEAAQLVPYTAGAWNGDCWKAWRDLRSLHGLEMYVIDTDQGCGIIRQNKTWHAKGFIQDYTWENFVKYRKEWLNLISVEEFKEKILSKSLQSLIYAFVGNPSDPEANFDLALHYDSIDQWASAISYYVRTAERSDDKQFQYEALIRASMCFAKQGTRGLSVRGLLNRAITILPKRPEAHYLLARWFERENLVESWVNCYTIANTALALCDFNSPPLRTWVDYPGYYGILFEKAVSGWWVGLCDESRDIFKDLLCNHDMDVSHRSSVINNLKFMKQFISKQFLVYDKSKVDRLRHRFSGAGIIEQNYSEAYQDIFVLSMLDGKIDGTFLEIGSGKPSYGNNTKLLEETFGWNGIAIDVHQPFVDQYNDERSSKCFNLDGTKIDWDKMLKHHNMPKDIDYLQLDAEPPEVTLACLKNIPFKTHRFAVITFEHDRYAEVHPKVQQESRKILSDAGYVLVAKNIAPDTWRNYEDWWVHPDLVSSTILMKMIDHSQTTKSCEAYMLK